MPPLPSAYDCTLCSAGECFIRRFHCISYVPCMIIEVTWPVEYYVVFMQHCRKLHVLIPAMHMSSTCRQTYVKTPSQRSLLCRAILPEDSTKMSFKIFCVLLLVALSSARPQVQSDQQIGRQQYNQKLHGQHNYLLQLADDNYGNQLSYKVLICIDVATAITYIMLLYVFFPPVDYTKPTCFEYEIPSMGRVRGCYQSGKVIAYRAT